MKVVREFVRKLSEEDLRYLNTRFRRGISDDKAEAANFLSEDDEIDSYLRSATSGDDFCNLLNTIADSVRQEYSVRYSKYRKR